MFRTFESGVSLWWDVIWQASAFLAAGIAVSAMLRRRPSRAHRVLVLAMVAAIGTPLISQAIRQNEWGLLRTRAQGRLAQGEVGPSANGELAASTPRFDRDRPHDRPDRLAATSKSPARGSESAKHNPAPVAKWPADAPANGEILESSRIGESMRRALLTLWACVSLLMACSLAVAMIRGRRLISEASEPDDPKWNEAAAIAAGRLGIAVGPEIRLTRNVRCPSIWCWSRRPVLLIPATIGPHADEIDWIAIFSHEIAHWRRLDHVSSLLGEILVCILPWHPLAWWAKSRMQQFAELACDDWVLSTGIDAPGYAESLMRFVPGRECRMALAAVTGRRGLFGRVRHILDDRRSSPGTGLVWSLGCGSLATLAVAAIALAQQGPANPAESERTEMQEKNVEPAGDSKERTAKGVIIGPGGKPLAGAKIAWITQRKPKMPFVAIPRDDDRAILPQPATLAQAVTDANGRFEIRATYDHENLYEMDGVFANLVVTAPELAITQVPIPREPLSHEFSIRMNPDRVIRGRLLTPSGAPAAGVRVTLDAINDDAEGSRQGLFVGPTDRDDAIPPFWPKPLRTDADGRFELRGVPQNAYASLTLRSPDFAVDDVTVSTRDDGAISKLLKAFEITPVAPDFTHTLKEARPVVGRVTDKATGKPLAGIAVEMIPMRSHGGLTFRGRTDSDGRYRISGHATDRTYHTTVFPPASSGYLDATDVQQGWPAGAKELVKDFALSTSRVVTGRVIDRTKNAPVAGAAVVYQPVPKNPNDDGTHDFRNPTLTDDQGRFTITALPGAGSLFVESPDANTIRIPVDKLRYRKTAYPHGYLRIDVPEGEPLAPVEIELRQGVTLAAKAIGPDGQPVKGVVAFCVGMNAVLIDTWNQGKEFPDAVFRMAGADPARAYRIFFISPEKRLGGVAEWKYDPNRKEPFEVRLEPTATIKGKLANPDGTLANDGQAGLRLSFTAEPRPMTDEERYGDTVADYYSNVVGQRHAFLHDWNVGEQADFEYAAIIPGAWFELNCTAGSRRAIVNTPILKPGETLDLGTITLRERTR